MRQGRLILGLILVGVATLLIYTGLTSALSLRQRCPSPVAAHAAAYLRQRTSETATAASTAATAACQVRLPHHALECCGSASL
jgi:hypothetical protein